eukprot:sb/3465418/
MSPAINKVNHISRKFVELLILFVHEHGAANAGPLLFTLLRHKSKRLASLKFTAYIILGLGFIAAVLLSQLWSHTAVVGGEESSVALLSLAFMFALLDCTSSVVFLPFMAKYPPGYMVPFYVGEGMSGVAPSLLALIQGAGGDTCSNTTTNTTMGEESGPRISVGVYFGLLSGLIALSGVAFHLLNTLDVSLTSRYTYIRSSSPGSTEEENEQDALRETRVVEVFTNPEQRSTRIKFTQLFLYTALIAGLGNGVIPAILSYACLPFGPTAYHLATELSLLANPVCCFLAFYIPCKRPALLGALTAWCVVVAGIILYTASLSPTPWLVGTTSGSVLIVLICVAWTGSTSYVKVNVASILQRYGENPLLYCGVVTQLGSCVGAVVIFLVNKYAQSFTPC